jgi:hypothetical protein
VSKGEYNNHEKNKVASDVILDQDATYCVWPGCRNDGIKGLKAQADPLWCKLVTLTRHGSGLGRRQLWQLVDKLQCGNRAILSTWVAAKQRDDRANVPFNPRIRVFQLPDLDIVGDDVRAWPKSRSGRCRLLSRKCATR